MIRGLSHGKFTGVVLTKSIAESVFTARLLSALREKKIDIDETVKAMHKDKTKRTIPDKTSEATKFIQPLVDMVMQQMQPYLVTIDQTATAPSSGDNKEFQDMQQDNAKLRQKFQQAGIPITPVSAGLQREMHNQQHQARRRMQILKVMISRFQCKHRQPRKGRQPIRARVKPTSSTSPQMCFRTISPATSTILKRGWLPYEKTSASANRRGLTPTSARCSRSLRTRSSRRMSCRLCPRDGDSHSAWLAPPRRRTCRALLRLLPGTACDASNRSSTRQSTTPSNNMARSPSPKLQPQLMSSKQ